MNRRQFLQSSAMAAMTALAPLSLANPLVPRYNFQPGVQLFTLMPLLMRDFDGTIEKVAAIGYREVELPGTFGQGPELAHKVLQRHGLTSPAQHIMPGAVEQAFASMFAGQMTEQKGREFAARAFDLANIVPIMEEAIAGAKVMGQKYIIWPALFEQHLNSSKKIDGVLRAFNIAADMCVKEGLVFGHHNHHWEFIPVGNDIPYDLLLQNTDPATVSFELDFYWAARARVDPIAYLEKYPGRFKLCHLKDMDEAGEFADVGSGVLDFPTLITSAQQAGIEHFFVEHDRPADPLQSITNSFGYLASLE